MLTSNARDAEMNANIEGKFGVTRTEVVQAAARLGTAGQDRSITSPK